MPNEYIINLEKTNVKTKKHYFIMQKIIKLFYNFNKLLI